MSSRQASKVKIPIETTVQLKQAIKGALDKLNNTFTVQTGLDELKEILEVNVTSATRMNVLILILTEQNEHMSIMHKREVAKIYGIMGEVFGESLVAFISRILETCEPKLEDPQLHVAISDSLGVMMHHIFQRIEGVEEQVAHLGSTADKLLEMARAGRPNVQVGAAMCLTRVVQNAPPEALVAVLPQLSDCLLEFIMCPGVKCLAQILEILISLILTVELAFEPHAKKFLPALIDCMQPRQDSMIRKIAIDVVYTLAAFIPNSLSDQSEIITGSLREAKTDKSKHVREAANEALLKMRDAHTREGRPLVEPSPARAKSELRGRAVGESEEVKAGDDEGYKSIFAVPVDPKFLQAAPKSGVEIRTITPIKNEEDEVENQDQKEEDNAPAEDQPEEPKEEEVPEQENKQDHVEEHKEGEENIEENAGKPAEAEEAQHNDKDGENDLDRESAKESLNLEESKNPVIAESADAVPEQPEAKAEEKAQPPPAPEEKKCEEKQSVPPPPTVPVPVVAEEKKQEPVQPIVTPQGQPEPQKPLVTPTKAPEEAKETAGLKLVSPAALSGLISAEKQTVVVPSAGTDVSSSHMLALQLSIEKLSKVL